MSDSGNPPRGDEPADGENAAPGERGDASPRWWTGSEAKREFQDPAGSEEPRPANNWFGEGWTARRPEDPSGRQTPPPANRPSPPSSGSPQPVRHPPVRSCRSPPRAAAVLGSDSSATLPAVPAAGCLRSDAGRSPGRSAAASDRALPGVVPVGCT